VIGATSSELGIFRLYELYVVSVGLHADEDICGDDVLLMMQFPAGEIGRKMALTVSHPMTPDKFRAREFPVGTGLSRFHARFAVGNNGNHIGIASMAMQTGSISSYQLSVATRKYSHDFEKRTED